jgi:hypothetical protein
MTDLLKINFFDYAKVLERIQSRITKPILVLYYDDIVTHPTGVLRTVVNHLNLPNSEEYFLNYTNNKINGADYRYQLEFSKLEKQTVNTWIDKASEYLKKDLSIWKK